MPFGIEATDQHIRQALPMHDAEEKGPIKGWGGHA